ncbi:ABC transporter permease [Corallococcus llansteffanensis]|uniref:ABC transporter permease n=1 Tax=Corallococcus llansteffanensis TaxID=2316731 RepID=A0A3A8Q6Y8_9BACT|nr:ABC transporter permease [Corallococcus llansteffanensis]RKH64473.1 ABC transporter permease [Corallococcus llansteffanensis]
MPSLLQDLRFTLRMLGRNRLFSVAVVVTLAMAIGATTAVATTVHHVLLRPLPYPQSDRLMRVSESLSQSSQLPATYPDLMDWRANARGLAGVEAFHEQDLTITGAGGPQRLKATLATSGLFSLLGVQPLLGRGWEPAEETSGHRLAVLDHGLWQRRFGGARDILGRTLILDGEPFTVVGVLPQGFSFVPGTEVWMPLTPDPESYTRTAHFLRIVARLAPGVTAENAARELTIRLGVMDQEATGRAGDRIARVVPWHEGLVKNVRGQLWLLGGVVILVLLIACANVANLMLTRATARQREVSVRVALGAHRWQLIQQFLIESLVLAFMGGAAGLLVASWSMGILRSLVPEGVQFQGEPGFDGTLLVIAFVTSLLTGVLFGLVPALRVSRAEARGALGGLAGHSATMRGAFGSLLVVAQVALAAVALVGSGLILRTLHSLQTASLGFEPRDVITAELSLPAARYPDEAGRRQFASALLDRLRVLPEVEATGLVSTLPMTGRNNGMRLSLPGESEDTARTRAPIYVRVASAGYFKALRVPLREGRPFVDGDGPSAPPVVLINEPFAQRFFPGRTAVGQRVKLGLGDGTWREVVGVVGAMHHNEVDEQVSPELFLPLEQSPLEEMALTVRMKNASGGTFSAVREQLRALDPDLPLAAVRSLDEVVDATFGDRRRLGSLLAALASLGLGLAAVGLYAVLALAVARQRRELGIRAALGASSGHLRGLVLGHGMRLVAGGILVGLLGAALVARTLTGLLYGVSAADPVTFAGVPLLLATIALSACWLPARRATRASPLESLRHEG